MGTALDILINRRTTPTVSADEAEGALERRADAHLRALSLRAYQDSRITYTQIDGTCWTCYLSLGSYTIFPSKCYRESLEYLS